MKGLSPSFELKNYLLLLARSYTRTSEHFAKLSAISIIQIAFIALLVLTSFAQISPVFAAAGGKSVNSNGAMEPYILSQVASASNPNQVYRITGAQLAQRLVSGAYKSYFYLYINTAQTFPVNTSDVVQKVTVSDYSTNNYYWNVQSGTSDGSGFCGTVGQDLDLGATSNTLSEWQWSNPNWDCGRPQVSAERFLRWRGTDRLLRLLKEPRKGIGLRHHRGLFLPSNLLSHGRCPDSADYQRCCIDDLHRSR